MAIMAYLVPGRYNRLNAFPAPGRLFMTAFKRAKEHLYPDRGTFAKKVPEDFPQAFGFFHIHSN